MFTLILMIFALVCFLMAAARMSAPRVDFIGLGLAALVLAQIFMNRPVMP